MIEINLFNETHPSPSTHVLKEFETQVYISNKNTQLQKKGNF